MERRAKVREMITTSMTGEAKVLSTWLKEKHPEAAQMKPKTIQNQLAAEWRALGEASRNGGPKKK
jgi:hypothetical protein